MNYWLDLVNEKCREKPIIYIIGTKLDKLESDPGKREVSEQEGINFASERGLEFYEVSSLTSRNVKQMFAKVKNYFNT